MCLFPDFKFGKMNILAKVFESYFVIMINIKGIQENEQTNKNLEKQQQQANETNKQQQQTRIQRNAKQQHPHQDKLEDQTVGNKNR